MLSRPLLDAVEIRSGGNDPYRTYVQRMREHLDAADQKLDLANAIRQTGLLIFSETNRLWIGEPDDLRLATLQPARVGSGEINLHVFLYAETNIINAFSNALQSIKGTRQMLSLRARAASEAICQVCVRFFVYF